MSPEKAPAAGGWLVCPQPAPRVHGADNWGSAGPSFPQAGQQVLLPPNPPRPRRWDHRPEEPSPAAQGTPTVRGKVVHAGSREVGTEEAPKQPPGARTGRGKPCPALHSQEAAHSGLCSWRPWERADRSLQPRPEPQRPQRRMRHAGRDVFTGERALGAGQAPTGRPHAFLTG